MADYSPVEDLSKRWEQKTRTNHDTTANLERISDSAMVRSRPICAFLTSGVTAD
jgi:hypothetical protein